VDWAECDLPCSVNLGVDGEHLRFAKLLPQKYRLLLRKRYPKQFYVAPAFPLVATVREQVQPADIVTTGCTAQYLLPWQASQPQNAV
jgi:hypothetical protein